MIKKLFSLSVSIAVLAVFCLAMSGLAMSGLAMFGLALSSMPVSAQAARDTTRETSAASRVRQDVPRQSSGADDRPTGPFDNQLKKFSAPLSANGAK